jgi:hypothetical protein
MNQIKKTKPNNRKKEKRRRINTHIEEYAELERVMDSK